LGSDGLGRVSLKKKIQVTSPGRVEHSVFFGSRVILGRAGSGFRFLLTQVILDFGSFRFGSGWVSGPLISDNLRFRVVSGRVGPDQILFLSCFISGRVRLTCSIIFHDTKISFPA
jgi:hypothetical protein